MAPAQNASENKTSATAPDLGAPQDWIDALMRVEGEGFGLRLDVEGRLVDVSAGGESIFGDLLGLVLWPLLLADAESEEPLQATIAATLRDELVWFGRAILKTPKGLRHSLSLFVRSVHDEQKRLLGYWMMGQNNAERRGIEEKLLALTNDLQQTVQERNTELIESQALYRHLVEDISEGYFIAKHGRLSFANQAFARITGYTQADLLGMAFVNLIVKRDDESAERFWTQVENGGLKGLSEFLISRKDGTRAAVEFKANTLLLGGEELVIGVIRDITRAKKLELQLRSYVDNLEKMVSQRTAEQENSLNELRRTQFQLVQSERMAGIGILAAGIAHEINNPLQALLLKGQHIARHAGEPQLVMAATRDIGKYVDRMAEIVKSLHRYALAAKDEDTGSPVDIVGALKSALELAHHTRSFGDIVVKRDFQAVPFVRGHHGNYQQIFIAIICNAIDAMQGQGTLTLKTGLEHDDLVSISLSDTGCGMPPEVQDKLFTPLFTTKPTGKGQGLGLHTAYRLITQYGGEIKVQSQVAQGSTFTLLLPAVTDAPPSA